MLHANATLRGLAGYRSTSTARTAMPRTVPCASSFCHSCSLLQTQCANYRTIKRKKNPQWLNIYQCFRLQTKMSGGRANCKVDTDSYSLNSRSETRPWAVSTKPTETIPQVVSLLVKEVHLEPLHLDSFPTGTSNDIRFSNIHP